jgi:NAD(P)-dependent dehydrogenase (short-subunit alcohol dehydrogenase family)
VIADVLEQEGRTLADELGDYAIFSRLDVTSDRDWAATVAAAEDAFGPVSVLVNNAAIMRFGPIAETETWPLLSFGLRRAGGVPSRVDVNAHWHFRLVCERAWVDAARFLRNNGSRKAARSSFVKISGCSSAAK